MTSAVDMFKKASLVIGENSPGILTGIGAAGVITTAYLTARASFKAAWAIEQEIAKRISTELSDSPAPAPTTKEKVELVWMFYIPAAASGVSTILAIIMSNRLASKEAAALTAAYTLSDKAFQEYKEKVFEKVGEHKEMAIRDEIAQDRINSNPVNTKELILAGAGEVLCYDLFTGRYFQSTMEKIRSAENKVNYDVVNRQYASLSTFYDLIGLPPTNMSDMLGFNIENRLEVKFSTVLSTDQRPCIAIDFASPPAPDYGKHVY